MKNEKNEISEDEWNSIQIFNDVGDRDIHIKEIDENLGMKYKYYVTTNKKGKTIYHMKSLNITPWLLGSFMLLSSTVACLYSIFSGEFKNDTFNLVLFIIITLFLIVADVWVIKNFISVIRIRINEKNKPKRSLLSKVFSFLLVLFVILLVFPIIAVFYLLLTKSSYLRSFIYDKANFEKYIIIYANILFGVGFLAFIIQLILAYDGWKKHKKNKYNLDNYK